MLGEAALRPDQHRERQRQRTLARGRERGDRIAHVGGLVAEHQHARRLARRDHALERDRLGDLGNAENAALLGGLDRVGAHALEIDASDLAVLHRDRLQPRGAHLDRLLHHVVEARVLERREQVVQIARRRLRPRLLADVERGGALAGVGEARAPLAVAAVEEEHAVAGFEPHDVLQIVRLRSVERQPRAGGERGVDIEARRAEIVARHRRGMPCYRPNEKAPLWGQPQVQDDRDAGSGRHPVAQGPRSSSRSGAARSRSASKFAMQRSGPCRRGVQ